MNKIAGYVIAGVGILLIALSFAQVRALIKIPLPAGATDMYLMIGGAVLAIVGGFLVSKSSKPEQPKEVPIYEGRGENRKVVAYQRMKKE